MEFTTSLLTSLPSCFIEGIREGILEEVREFFREAVARAAVRVVLRPPVARRLCAWATGLRDLALTAGLRVELDDFETERVPRD